MEQRQTLGWAQGATFPCTARTRVLHKSPRSLLPRALSSATVSSGCLWKEPPEQGMARAACPPTPSPGEALTQLIALNGLILHGLALSVLGPFLFTCPESSLMPRRP